MGDGRSPPHRRCAGSVEAGDLDAGAADWGTDGAAVVAAEFALAADDAVARFPGAERLGARLVQRDAGALAADVAAVGPFDAEDGGAGTGARDRDADPGAVGAAGGGVAAVPDIVHASVAVRARNAGDAAAKPAGVVDDADRNVGAGATKTDQAKRGAGEPSQHSPA